MPKTDNREEGDWLEAEPFRIKVVEPIRRTTRAERERLVEEAGFNLFSLRSEDVFIDLLTDSGTSAMSDRQWAGIMLGDEAYAGSRNFYHLQEVVEDLFGFPYVIPTHQGRGAENVLFATVLSEGQYVPNNMHFDTTKAHVEHRGGIAVNLPIPEAYDPEADHPFKGDMDLAALDDFLKENGEQVALTMVTITCNSGGGQPVSMANIRGVSEICKKHGIMFIIDACRFAENAFFIKEREDSYQDKDINEIVREIMSYADGCTMSGKKDALVNIGGFLALRDEDLYQQATVWGVLFEGFPTYGGLAGRDIEAMARGLEEVTDEAYLAYRIGQIRYLAGLLDDAGVPIIKPPGGHAVYLDARRFLPHVPQKTFPGQAIAIELYIEGGVRGVEIGTVLSGRDPRTGENICPELDMVRLTIPRRVYTNRHMKAIVETVKRVYQRRDGIGGLVFEYEPPVLRHFTARFKRV